MIQNIVIEKVIGLHPIIFIVKKGVGYVLKIVEIDENDI